LQLLLIKKRNEEKEQRKRGSKKVKAEGRQRAKEKRLEGGWYGKDENIFVPTLN
jgi:hypothetical protein